MNNYPKSVLHTAQIRIDDRRCLDLIINVYKYY